MTSGISAFACIGGKAGLADKIIPYIPPHVTYCEPFAGGAAVLLNKPPSLVEVVNDINGDIVTFWRVLRDQRDAFIEALQATPYARDEYAACDLAWRNQDPATDVERARRWYVLMRQSFGGKFRNAWGYSAGATSRGMAMTVARWMNSIDQLPEIAARIMRVQIESGDWSAMFDRYDGPETAFYCDPPYHPDATRDRAYASEMTAADHTRFIDRVLLARGMVLISAYAAPEYDRLAAHGWHRVLFDVACYSVGKTRASGLQGTGALARDQRRTEVLYLSPNCGTPTQLNLFTG